MFVAIDMNALRVLHKHHDHETVSALSWLECGQQVSVRVEPYHDRSVFLRSVSDLDVRMLYKNSTGQPLPKDADAAAIRYQLADAVQLMPATRAVTSEVLAQVEAVDDRLHAGERFRYAKGAKVPAQAAELFPVTTRPLTERELATAQSHSRTPVAGYPPRLTGQPRKPWEPELPSAPAPSQAVPPPPPAQATEPATTLRTPRQSVRPVVRAAADKLLADLGGAALFADWPTHRAALIQQLEADGYHPTTIRIKLSEWTKEHGV